MELDKIPITMKYQYQGQVYVSKLDDQIKWVTDTKVGNIELEDIKTQLDWPRLEAPLRIIKRLGLVEATIFPQSVQVPKFIMTIAQFYDADTRKCTDDQGRTVIDLSTDMLGFMFGIFARDEVLLTTEEEAARVWSNNIASNKRNMNENWLEEERKTWINATKILRANFKEPERDLIIMLSKVFGKPDYRHFHS